LEKQTKEVKVRESLIGLPEKKRRLRLSICFQALLAMSPLIGFSQLDARRFEDVINENGIHIEMYYEKPKTICANKDWRYKLKFHSIPAIPSQSSRFLTYKFKTINCDDYLVENVVSIDLSLFDAGNDLIGNRDWTFNAKSIENGVYDVRLQAYHSNEKTRILSRVEALIDPTEVRGNRVINSLEELTLSVTGGKIPSNGKWVWYKNGCGSTQIVHTGETFRLRPGASGTYYVRGESPNFATKCIRVDVLVDDESAPPTGILTTSNLAQAYCKGSSTPWVLEVKGGRLGLYSKWVWYKGGISASSFVDTGSVIRVIPSEPTTYYVRAEGRGGMTPSVSYFLDVLPQPRPATRIDLQTNYPERCADKQVMLSAVSEPVGGDAQWTWVWKASEGGMPSVEFDRGKSVYHTPSESTIYTVTGVNRCGSSAPLSMTYDVLKPSVAPNSVRATSSKGKTKLAIDGSDGRLGDKSQWYWYSDSSLKRQIGEGGEIFIRGKKAKDVFLVASGPCNVTLPYKVKVASNSQKKRFGFMNFGVINNTLAFEDGRMYDFFAAVGFGRLYLKGVFGIPRLFDDVGSKLNKPEFESNDQRILNYPVNSGTYYQFTPDIYPKLRTYTLGFYGGTPFFNVYGGAGYGTYDLNWGVKRFSYAADTELGFTSSKNINQSLSGPCAEAGFLLNTRILNVMFGANLIYSIEEKKSYVSGHLGIGFTFRSK
jgi:hypothetical protein